MNAGSNTARVMVLSKERTTKSLFFFFFTFVNFSKVYFTHVGFRDIKAWILVIDMAKIKVVLNGASDDITRLYEHLTYNVKKISKYRYPSDNAQTIEFTVVI